jgi:transcription elongation factor GreA
MDSQPISQEGYNKLREEIRLLEEEMPKIAEKIKQAREEGDLSENAEYHGQRDNMRHLDARIKRLKVRLASCHIVDKKTVEKGVVGFGSTVTVKDLSDGSKEKYELVGPGEENYDGDVMKILTSSPVAQALMGKKAGDEAEVQAPSGMLRFEIVSVEDA